jgi:hypothetical protein
MANVIHQAIQMLSNKTTIKAIVVIIAIFLVAAFFLTRNKHE